MSSENPVIIEANPAIGKTGDIHIYLPEGKSGPLPFIVGIHGGGWSRGEQTAFAWMWPDVKSLGIPLELVSYRTAPAHPFPCAYEDLCHALAWLKENGAKHGLNPEKCVLYGSSAGGHLAMLLATRGLKENRPMPVLCGVAQHGGIMDLASQYAFDIIRKSTMTKDFLGSSPEENPEIYRESSPIENIHDRMPPIWIGHGSVDQVVPVTQSRTMVERLRQAGQNVVYLEAEGLPHTMVETFPDGKDYNPPVLIFRNDFDRFVYRTILRS